MPLLWDELAAGNDIWEAARDPRREGRSAEDVRAKAQALALRVVADRLEHGKAGPDLLSISFKAA